MSNKIKIGYYQFAPKFGDVKINTDRIIKVLLEKDFDIIVLPELALTGYNFSGRDELDSLAEKPTESESVKKLQSLCSEKNAFIVTGFAEKQSDKIYNSSLLIGPDGLVDRYRKLHLFNNEKKYFDDGDLGLKVNEVKGIKVGMMICFDWIFPEVARTLKLNGAELICHPSNLVLKYCQSAMITRCLENGLTSITCNRYGTETSDNGELTFTGSSQTVGPNGNLLSSSSEDTDHIAIIEIEKKDLVNTAITPLNDKILDRRTEYYIGE